MSDHSRSIGGPTPPPRRQVRAEGLVNFGDRSLAPAAPITLTEPDSAEADVVEPSQAPASAAPFVDAAVETLMAPVAAPVKRVKPPKNNFTAVVPPYLQERVRAMHLLTGLQEGERTLSDTVCEALEELCQRREAMYNGGRTFELTGVKVRQGRPLGPAAPRE